MSKKYYFCSLKSGSSSVGRASASQAEGRGFETRFPLFTDNRMTDNLLDKENTEVPFKYIGYQFSIDDNVLTAYYNFRVFFNDKHVDFYPTLQFIIPQKYFDGIFDYQRINEIVFNLGMVESISYWKTTCQHDFIVACHDLSENQIEWWKDLFYYGLGEFRYKNHITTDKDNFIKFYPNPKYSIPKPISDGSSLFVNKIIIPVGGGKDSVVTMEELKNRHDIIPFVINPNNPMMDCIKTAGFSDDDVFVVNRQLDPSLLKLNEQGALNGHTPFSAIVAFCSLIAAEMTNTSMIALSNEESANESTVANNNDIINHQYSKTFAFESSFRKYYKKYISSNYNYFSYLRSITELKIAEKFSHYPQYYKVFRSCNVGSKQGNIWCGNCPKCLFVYIMLMPFIPKDELTEIFGSNLLLNDNLQETLFQLTGLSETKPFECVGTVKETRAAIAKYLSENEPEGILVPYIAKCKRSETVMDLIQFGAMLNHYNASNFIPEKL